MTAALIETLRGLADGRGRIAADSNTRTMLEEAADLRLVRLTGAMKMRSTTEQPVGLKVAGKEYSLPVVGALWDVYELIGEAKP